MILATIIGSPDALAERQLEVVARPAEGGGVLVEAQARLKAHREVIWSTLTDYDNLDRFIPGMHKSQIAQRHDNSVIVHQQGAAHLLFFTYAIDVVVEAVEEPFSRIRVHLVSGNLRRLEGGYEVERVAAGADEYVLHWSGVIDTTAALPEFLQVPLMRRNILEQFQGMVDEIDRRDALYRAAQTD